MFCVMSICFALLSTNVSAASNGTCGDNLTWALNDEGVLAISGTGEMYDFSYNSSPWYDSADIICSVIIEDGVTTIGDYAFYSCDSLTSITIPNSVSSIGLGTFRYCNSLININVNTSNLTYTSQDGVLFNKDKTALIYYPEGKTASEYTIPDGVTSIEDRAFYYNKNLTNIKIPDGVTTIGNRAFYYCRSLTNIAIPDGVTTIGDSAFYRCEALKSIMLPNSVTTIGESVFEDCSSLTSVTLSNNITEIAAYAFYYCNSLTKITIPYGVTTIGECAFEDCSSLTSVTLPNSVEAIDWWAFSQCDSLTSIMIPNSVNSIASRAFYSCDLLTNISVNALNTSYASQDGVLFNKDKTTLICYPKGKTTGEYIIPNGVTTIGNGAFSSCNALTSITIPDGVTSIGDSAFSSCNGLTDITIPNSVITMGESAFEDCSRLTSVTLSEGVTEIAAYAFCYCDTLTNIAIPKSVVSIGISAFEDCSALTDVYYSGAETEWNAIEMGNNNEKLQSAIIHYSSNDENVGDIDEFVASGNCGENLTWTLDDEGTLTISGKGEMGDSLNFDRPWRDYSNAIYSVIIEKGVTSISDAAFSGCSNLTSVTIGESVTLIGDNAFNSCRNLKNVTIPDSVKSIGDSAFYYCYYLTSVTIGNSVETIGNDAFSGCNNITRIKMGDGIKVIGDGAFFGCGKIGNVTIPNNVISIGNYAFCSWINLTNITIPDSVTTIGDYAFSSCNRLTNATIGDGVTEIGDYAFSDCNSLTSIIIGDDVISIGIRAFSGCEKLASVTIPDSVISIGNYAFHSCRSLTSVTLSNSLTTIGEEVFYCCISLTDVMIPDSVIAIGDAAFASCVGMTTIKLGNGVISIGESAFGNCGDLSYVYYFGTESEWNAISIGDYNEDLKSATIYYNSTNKFASSGTCGDNLIWTLDYEGTLNISGKGEMGDFLYIYSPWYDYRKTIYSVTIENGVTSIGSDAFYRCYNLTSITIPDSVTSINTRAFYDCDALTNVYYVGSKKKWDNISIGSNNTSLTQSSTIFHYGSGNEYTPTNTNPAKSSESSYTKSYGTKLSPPKLLTDDEVIRKNLLYSVDRFYKVANEYIDTVKTALGSEVVTEDAIIKFAKELEEQNASLDGTRLTISSSDAKVKEAAYVGYAYFLNDMVQKGIEIGKVNLNEMEIMLDYNLTKKILSNLRSAYRQYEYKNYQISIKSVGFGTSFIGNINIITPNKGTVNGIITSSISATTSEMENLIGQLKKLASEVEVQMKKAAASDLMDITGVDKLASLIKKNSLKNLKPLKKLGLGSVVDTLNSCHTAFNEVNKLIKDVEINEIDDIIENPQDFAKNIASAYEINDAAVDVVVNAAQKKVEDALCSLMQNSRSYKENRCGEDPTLWENVKDWFSKKFAWVSSVFQCPVEFEVYNEDETLIGYVRDGAVYYNDDIYIELNGDVKTLYVPVGMKVDIKMIGTEDGIMNYYVEETIYNEPTGRLNYYNIPLTAGGEFTQAFDTTTFRNDTSAMPILLNDEEIYADEYISSEDATAYVIISASSSKNGFVLGGGDYAKGDCVTLTAVADDNYIFNGWYVNDELMSMDTTYRFTALENTDIYADFIRSYNINLGYDTTISDGVDNLYPYIYTDFDGESGIVLVPFNDESIDDISIKVTMYDGSNKAVASNDMSATLQNGVYAYENMDLTDIEYIKIFDSSDNLIATINSVDKWTYYTVSKNYVEAMDISAIYNSGNINIKIDIFDNTSVPKDITAYLAEYNEFDVLKSCSLIQAQTEENQILFTAPMNENCKIFLWTSTFEPLSEVIMK